MIGLGGVGLDVFYGVLLCLLLMDLGPV
jgi:hypothetical protein